MEQKRRREGEGDGRDGRKGGLRQQVGLLLCGVWRSSSRWDVPVGVREVGADVEEAEKI